MKVDQNQNSMWGGKKSITNIIDFSFKALLKVNI